MDLMAFNCHGQAAHLPLTQWTNQFLCPGVNVMCWSGSPCSQRRSHLDIKNSEGGSSEGPVLKEKLEPVNSPWNPDQAAPQYFPSPSLLSFLPSPPLSPLVCVARDPTRGVVWARCVLPPWAVSSGLFLLFLKFESGSL